MHSTPPIIDDVSIDNMSELNQTAYHERTNERTNKMPNDIVHLDTSDLLVLNFVCGDKYIYTHI